ncbi:MAG TPA: PKD domain-containing protein [Verrucomicrobiae bacterium]|nr:PKD domain-containing protein [Verrucomicrobiae bacterium]
MNGTALNLRLGTFLVIFGVCYSGLGPMAQAATSMTPISVTGFNRDLVVENTASGPPYGSYALEFNPNEGTAFYQSGLPGTSYGLPTAGSFTSALGDGTVFQFQPYTASNALVLSSETSLTSGTLTLVTPTTYSRIAILANSANASSTSIGTLTVHFNDGTTLVTNYNAQDWFFNPGFALQGVDRINLNSGGTQGGPSNPRFYQTTVDLWAALGTMNKPVTSLTFGKASAANSTAIYAVSGLPSSSITAPSVTTSAATNIQARGATVGGQVSGTGGESPLVTVFYGATDGGTTPGNWAHNVALGLQAGTFSANLTNLTPNAPYYFTARAVNSAATAWATPSKTFSTPQLTLPVMTNEPASDVQGTFATLNGAVLATGGETPSVTVYYGTSDGGSNPANWAHSVVLGGENASFAQTVNGLSPTTSYFFTVSGVNSAGTAWAMPSQSFTTQATNSPSSGTAVLTHHNDNGRTGMNLGETILNVGNVNSNQFGLVATRPVDDQIYAQPLVMTNVNLRGQGTHNIVVVCTVNDSVYAFDADNPLVTNAYWTVSFVNPPNIVPPSNADMSAIGACGGGYQDFSGNIGIVGTPVIDPATGTLYVVARTKEYGTNFVQRLHALDLTTGAERPNSPVIISATYAGTGDGSSGGIIRFDTQRENQRPALALANGVVYISWSSHCDNGPYHGWVIGYDETTLLQVTVYNDTPNGSDGGIWMSGQGPAVDAAGNLYLSVGNGTVDTSGTVNRGESFLKLTRSGTNLTVASWFTPYDWQTLESGDLDLGSGGLLLLPGTNLVFSGGKEGVAYLVNRDNMGGLTASTSTNDNILQYFSVTSDEVHGGAVWWDGPTNSYCYLWPSSVYLQQYIFNRGTGRFVLPPFAQSPTAAPGGQPGGILALSANGTNAATAIIWAAHQLNGDANQQVLPGILHAYSAQNVSNELWNSSQNSARDSVGNFAKFVPPTVANGKVYLATFSNQLNVYGLLPTAQLGVSPAGLSFGPVAVGSHAELSLVLTNLGGAPLTNGMATVSGPFSIVSGTPFSLAPFGATNLVVRFSPAIAGNFTNNLAITTGNGGNSTNVVSGTGAAVPVANFSASPTRGTWPLLVSFTDNSSGTITNDLWNFGDGTITSTVPGNITHLYQAAGTDTVVLTVSGPVGTNTLTRIGYIIVTNPPPVTVTLQRSGNQWQLSWPSGTLQSSVNVAGPYTNLTSAVSPYPISPTEATRFFRVKVR